MPAYAADLARFWRVLRPDRPRAPAGQARELTLYLADLMDCGRADGTWPRRLSEIAVYHRAAGFSSSPIEHEVAQHPKTALIDVDLRQTIGAIDLTSRIGLRDRASLLLGFAGVFQLAALEVTSAPRRSCARRRPRSRPGHSAATTAHRRAAPNVPCKLTHVRARKPTKSRSSPTKAVLRGICEGSKMHYDFEWDPVKAQINLAAHGVPFELAQDVFEDPLLLTKPDPRHDDRWISTGEVRGTLLVVVHTDVEATPDEGQVRTRIRIISARIADRKDRRAYRDER